MSENLRFQSHKAKHKDTIKAISTNSLFGLKILFVFYIFSLCSTANAIDKLNIDPLSTCNYYGELVIPSELYGFESDDEAREIVKKILKYSGLEANFQIQAANVPNAAAVLSPENKERVVLYSQDFMEKVKDRTQTDWSSISILAHEIGHHLQGHTLQPGGSRPPIELEADKYSGFIVAMLGGTLDDAQAAIKLISSETGSTTHPPKSSRLAAITNGWKQAKEQLSEQSEGKSSPVHTQRPRNMFELLATIDDSDGYTNIRSQKSSSSQIIGKIYEGETFYTFYQSGNWWQIKTDDGKVGYMHISRIRLIDP